MRFNATQQTDADESFHASHARAEAGFWSSRARDGTSTCHGPNLDLKPLNEEQLLINTLIDNRLPMNYIMQL
jgi:hypothetical protein